VIFMTIIGTENRGRHFESPELPIADNAPRNGLDIVAHDVEHGLSEGKPAAATIEDIALVYMHEMDGIKVVTTD